MGKGRRREYPRMAQRHCQGQVPALRSRGVIALAVLIVTMPLGSWGRWLPLLASMIAVMTAAVLKERRIDPKAGMQDILATLAGGAVIWAEFIVIALIAQ